jgi:hypothetical protein
MTDDPNQPKSKLIIDEDWKTQAQREKERLQAEMESKRHEAPPDEGQMPPASFAMLVSTLATQALLFLGQMPNPMTGQLEVRLEEAKHFVDTLQILEDKTKGNLTPDESEMLQQVLHELRLAYVTLSKRAGSASPLINP